MHSGISILSGRSEFHRCQSRPTLSKMGKQADPATFSFYGSSRLSLPRLSSFCPWRDHFGGRMHLCLCSLGSCDMCRQKPVPSGSTVRSRSPSFSIELQSKVCIRRRSFGITLTSKSQFLATLMLVASVTDCLALSSVSTISQRGVSDSSRSGRFVSTFASRQATCQSSICSRISGPGHTMSPNTLGTPSFLCLYFLVLMYLRNIENGGKLSAHLLFVFKFCHQ